MVKCEARSISKLLKLLNFTMTIKCMNQYLSYTPSMTMRYVSLKSQGNYFFTMVVKVCPHWFCRNDSKSGLHQSVPGSGQQPLCLSSFLYSSLLQYFCNPGLRHPFPIPTLPGIRKYSEWNHPTPTFSPGGSGVNGSIPPLPRETWIWSSISKPEVQF